MSVSSGDKSSINILLCAKVAGSEVKVGVLFNSKKLARDIFIQAAFIY